MTSGPLQSKRPKIDYTNCNLRSRKGIQLNVLMRCWLWWFRLKQSVPFLPSTSTPFMNTAQCPVTLRGSLNMRGTVTPQLTAGHTSSPYRGRLLWCLLQEGSIAAPHQQPLSAQPQGHAAADAKFSYKKTPLVRSWPQLLGRLPSAPDGDRISHHLSSDLHVQPWGRCPSARRYPSGEGDQIMTACWENTRKGQEAGWKGFLHQSVPYAPWADKNSRKPPQNHTQNNT